MQEKMLEKARKKKRVNAGCLLFERKKKKKEKKMKTRRITKNRKYKKVNSTMKM